MKIAKIVVATLLVAAALVIGAKLLPTGVEVAIDPPFGFVYR